MWNRAVYHYIVQRSSGQCQSDLSYLSLNKNNLNVLPKIYILCQNISHNGDSSGVSSFTMEVTCKWRYNIIHHQVKVHYFNTVPGMDHYTICYQTRLSDCLLIKRWSAVRMTLCVHLMRQSASLWTKCATDSQIVQQGKTRYALTNVEKPGQPTRRICLKAKSPTVLRYFYTVFPTSTITAAACYNCIETRV